MRRSNADRRVRAHAKPLTRRTGSARNVRADAAVESAPGAAKDEERNDGDNAILSLLREPYIAWDKDGRGHVVDIGSEADAVPPEQLRFPVPGSAIRGSLAHRTLFHANGANGRFIDADEWQGADDEEKRRKREEYETRDGALRDFFGAAGEAKNNGGDVGEGRSGRVLFNDAEVRGAKWIGIDHVSIDRFTGGARELTGALFREEVLLGGRIEAEVVIRPPLKPANGDNAVDGWPRETAEAFLRAVRDLCRGRLALGGRSHGTCRGTVRFAGQRAKAWCDVAHAVGAPIEEANE